jgi:pimeloyl-ACP methyl ester carboxylesterase
MNYFEVRGVGEPCVLLHGGFGSIEMFGARVDELAKHRRVIAIDMRAWADAARRATDVVRGDGG